MEKLGGKDTESRDWERSLGGMPGWDTESMLESLSGQSPAEGHPEADGVDLGLCRGKKKSCLD